MTNKILKIIKNILFIILIFFLSDLVIFYFLPTSVKDKLYINRAHRIKSFEHHHDLRPMSAFQDHWGYIRYKITTNDQGFKDVGRIEVKFKKNNILFIGDSFTEGVGLNYNDTFVGIIEKKLKKNNTEIEVLNAGVQTYSPSIYLSKVNKILNIKKLPITELYVVIANGDVADDYNKYLDVNENYILNHIDFQNKYIIKLINFYKGNTLFYQFITRVTPPKVIPQRIKSLFKNESTNKFKNYAEYEQHLINTVTNEDIMKTQNYWIDRNKFNFFFDKENFDNWGQKAIKNSVNHIERLIRLASEKDIKTTIILIEESALFLKKPREDLLNFYVNSFKKVADTLNADFIYLNDYHSNFSDKFEAYKNLFFINDIHWNIKGHQAVANEILNKSKFLKKYFQH